MAELSGESGTGGGDLSRVEELMATVPRPALAAGARVAVAMSGGVDSSVTAALLKAWGYEVVGITLQLYDHGAAVGRAKSCCAGRDIHDARRIAEALGIAHYVLDYEDRFRQAVMEDFADSYLAGETPVPCVRCNERVKFADLLQTARELGAAGLVTGHYVQRREGARGPELLQGAEAGRDQSYFMFTLTAEQLAFLHFPLGGLSKDQTRALASGFDLSVAAKPDSQDICFVPQGDYAEVVKKLRPQAVRTGQIVHVDGSVLGEHGGISHFTIGQRRGLGVATGTPLYVITIDRQRRQVVVGPRQALESTGVVLRDVNWLGDESLDSALAAGRELFVRIRSTQAPFAARLTGKNDGVTVCFAESQYGVSPGQACVFYQEEGGAARLLGGGWIEEVLPQRLTDRRNRCGSFSTARKKT